VVALAGACWVSGCGFRFARLVVLDLSAIEGRNRGNEFSMRQMHWDHLEN
jgi:hypothetical protein